MAFTSLAHHIDIDWLREAFRRTRKGGAPGVDGRTAVEYQANLEENLRLLLERVKAGTYRAPPVRRVHVPKGDGKEQRPIGIPTFEDKVLQRAVVMLLEPIYERDFSNSSYGFRPGRSAHDALRTLEQVSRRSAGGWVLEVDIRKFFDTLNHEHLRAMICRRVRDGALLRLIGKWLRAGVIDQGRWMHPEAGTPQGGVISPLLANIYLHEVLDTWFESEVAPRVRGVTLIRYADDVVLFFARQTDAMRVRAVLPKRLGRYGLTLHPEKTRLVDFRRSDRRRRAAARWPTTFDLLGFTHHWGRLGSGIWIVRRSTAKDRFRRGLRAVNDWCRQHRHWSIAEQRDALALKVRGHYEYFGLPGNHRALRGWYWEVRSIWRKWLSRRSHRARVSWGRMIRLLQRHPLPHPSITSPRHSA